MAIAPAAGPLSRAINLADVRAASRRRLPRVLFDFVDGGSEGEATLRANAAQFDGWVLRPRQASLAPVTTAIELFGRTLSMPVLVAPCGSARMIHPAGELALARAAAAAGTVYVMPHMAGTALEEAAVAARPGPAPWYQLYKIGGRDVAAAAVERAATAGYAALVVTIDNGMSFRERDARNGLAALTAGDWRALRSHLPQLLARPGWLRRYLATEGRDRFPNAVRDGRAMTLRDVVAASREPGGVFDWDDLRWLRGLWRGPLVVKSVLTGEDAHHALDAGADAIVVSNHGGRGLDGASATLPALVEVAAAVDGQVPLLVDGGFRRGPDIVKALALGARAVLVGRPTLFGLVFGQPGVEQVLAMLRADLLRTLAMLGRGGVASIDEGAVRRSG